MFQRLESLVTQMSCEGEHSPVQLGHNRYCGDGCPLTDHDFFRSCRVHVGYGGVTLPLVKFKVIVLQPKFARITYR